MKPDKKVVHALVVDDQPISRKVMELMLLRLGCHATLCESGLQSIDAVKQTDFDVIFLDINMPGMDGFAATQFIREIQATDLTTPIILMSADLRHEHEDFMRVVGANDFICKPVDMKSLQATLEKYVQG